MVVHNTTAVCNIAMWQRHIQKRCIGLKWPTSQMANGILKFMIGHLKLVSSGQQDFKDCDWPLRLVSDGQSQTLKSTRPNSTFEPRPKWLPWPFQPAAIENFYNSDLTSRINQAMSS